VLDNVLLEWISDTQYEFIPLQTLRYRIA